MRSWAKGNKKIIDYYEGEVREWVKVLRVTAHRYLNERANDAELQLACRRVLENLEKKREKSLDSK